MKNLFLVLNWILGLFFLSLFILSIAAESWLPSLFVLIITILLLPSFRRFIILRLGLPLPFWLRSVAIPILFVLFIITIFMGMGNKDSVYKTPDIKAKLMAIYDSRIEEWPVPFETRYIETQYGKVHVIISGPADAAPVILLHASAMAGWSWLYNIEGMNQHYRTYAIDTIGDAGRSELRDIENFPPDGKALAMLYSEIMDRLGIEKACFIGASQGGFIATNMALFAPERVSKLVLCGPMGYGGTNLSVLRILLTTMFPVKPLQKSTARWAFGDDPRVNAIVDEWFSAILAGVISRQARPQPFSPQQLRQLNMPVLFLLGTRDGLVGDPLNTRKIARDIPNARVELLDTGHLISAEKPQEFNRLVHEFIQGI